MNLIHVLVHLSHAWILFLYIWNTHEKSLNHPNLLFDGGRILRAGHHDASSRVSRVQRLEGADGILWVTLVPELEAHLLAVHLHDLERKVAVRYFGCHCRTTIIVFKKCLNDGRFACGRLAHNQQLLEIILHWEIFIWLSRREIVCQYRNIFVKYY